MLNGCCCGVYVYFGPFDREGSSQRAIAGSPSGPAVWFTEKACDAYGGSSVALVLRGGKGQSNAPEQADTNLNACATGSSRQATTT